MNTKITLKKRILSVLLTLILVLSMVPLSAFAAGNAAAVTAGGKTTEFATYDLAVAYANQQESCTLKLLENIVSPQYEDTDSIPFITGNVTLDLNGKEIDAVDVGAVSYDEETDETVKGASGTLTVTGDGSVDYLTVNHGTLTLNGGTVEELSANSFAAAVGITGGTVKKLSLSSSGDEKITAAVSGGSVQVLNLDDAAVSFTGGNHGLKTGNWAINSGTLNISGGSYSTLNFLVVGGNICLSGGEFGYISTDPKMASSEYKKPILGSILGDNCAFYGTDGSIVNADALTLENVRIITNHEHTYKDGKCTTCGASCNHKGKVNYSDGICETCGTQLEAEVKYENGTSSYFDSFISAIDSVPHGMKDAVTVYLLKDFYRIDDDLYLANNNKINLNLNAKVLSGNGKIVVENGSSLTLAGGDIDKSLTVEAAGGDVTIEDTCSNIGNISVTSADSAVSIKGGNAERLSLAFTDTKSLKNVKLSGGKFKYISFNGSGTVAVTDMLEAGYAFKDNKGTLSGKAGSLMSYGVLWPANTYFAEFEVVKCDHGEANDRLGSCNFCGKIYKAKITDKNGAVRYTDELQETDFADGNTVVLFSDISDRIIPKGDCTIDLNGHSVSLISFIVQDGTLTLKGYGTVISFILGYQDIASTLAIEPTTSSDKTITIKNLSVNNTVDTKLTCGNFKYIEVKKAYFSVNDLLADGYSFYNETWGQLYYAGNATSIRGEYHIENTIIHLPREQAENINAAADLHAITIR